MAKGIVRLNGKRVEGVTIVDDAYVVSDGSSYITVPEVEAVSLQKRMIAERFYVDKKKIKPMAELQAVFDKTEIENDGIDRSMWIVETHESMEIVVVHKINGNIANHVFRRKPENGILCVEIYSEALGDVTVAAVGETCYTKPLTIHVI